MVITRKLKLYPNKKKGELLQEIADRQTVCVNWWIDRIREVEHTNVKELHQKFYRRAREEFDLGAVMIQLAEFVAIRLARTAKKKRKDSPYLKQKLIAVNQIKIEKKNLGTSFGRGYVWTPFKSQEIPQGRIKESKIKNVNGVWYCFLLIEISEPKPKGYKRMMGVDLGLAKIATLADWNGRNTKFFRGEQLRRKRQHYYNLRKKLHPKLKQGNVYKVLKRNGQKESNWIRTTNHQISRAIVNVAIKNKRTIVLENLTGITERLKVNKKTRRMLSGWSFRQLADFIKYKARLAGLPDVLVIDPRGTSKTCPKCKYTSRSNRKSQERFKCNKCNYESNADRVASMNIAQKGIELLASR